jgi:tartrate-resistant acid phosphatase type 5
MSATDQVSRRSFLAALAGLAVKPGPGTASEPELSFLAIGDWGMGSVAQKGLANALASTADLARARFIVSTGDNFYPAGVKSVRDPQWTTSFEDMYDAPSLMIPWYPVLGNHDHRGDIGVQVAYTQRSSRWRMSGAYYKRSEALADGSFAEFFFIDTTPILRHHASWTGRFSTNDQIAWLERELASSTARWKIVVGHHPAYSGNPGKVSRALVDWLVPLLERHRVQVYLNGHSHSLEHIVVRGVNYLTSGAGAKPRNASPSAYTRFVAGQVLGFLVVRLSPNTMELEFRDDTGNSLYRAQA